MDEAGVLGAKKRERVYTSLKESDAALIVVDILNEASVKSAEELLHLRPVRYDGSASTSHSRALSAVDISIIALKCCLRSASPSFCIT